MTEIEDVMQRIAVRFGGDVTAITVTPSLFERIRNRYNYANSIGFETMPFLSQDAKELYFFGIQIVKGEPCPGSEKE